MLLYLLEVCDIMAKETTVDRLYKGWVTHLVSGALGAGLIKIGTTEINNPTVWVPILYFVSGLFLIFPFFYFEVYHTIMKLVNKL